MRILLLVFAGLTIVYLATGYSQRSPAAPTASPEPYYVNGQPLMTNPNPADRGPEEKAARAAHQAALNGVYDAVGYPLRAMCAPEQRLVLLTALNTYYLDRLRFERHGGWFSADKWKNTAFDWQTVDDQAVERLTRLAFVNRYFVISELDPRVANAVRELVRGKQSQKRCAEDFELWPAHYLHEQMLKNDRETARAETLAYLTARWARSCQPAARKVVSRQVDQYYRERVRQHETLMDWGAFGLRRASAEWDTEGDRTIDGLVRMMMREGYLSLDHIHKDARPLVASLVGGPEGAPRCPEQSAKAK